MFWKHAVSIALASCLSSAVTSCGRNPDPIRENFGARVSPYGGFLALPVAGYPNEYKEQSHHYSKAEYVLYLKAWIGGKPFGLDIIESDTANFFPPNAAPTVTFVFQGVEAHVFEYSDHISGRPNLVLYWMNPPKQRISISVEQLPSQEWSPERLVQLLGGMTLAAGKPAFEQPAKAKTTVNAGNVLAPHTNKCAPASRIEKDEDK